MRSKKSWTVSAVALLMGGNALAADIRLSRLNELMAGANGDARVQFIEIATGSGPVCWNPAGQSVVCGNDASAIHDPARLTFYDAVGRETGEYVFPGDLPAGRGSVLVATRAFADMRGAPAPDFIMPPFVNAVSGVVCFSPQSRAPQDRRDCVSYGQLDKSVGLDALPAPRLEIVNTHSLQRLSDSSFRITKSPTPRNAAGATFRLPLAPIVAQGRTLFERETFQGNGRTCSTCHVERASFGLDSHDVAARFATLAQSYDPLFIAETIDFDFNLNLLTLTQPSAPADLGGTIHGTTGVAKVLARTGPTTYLVYGGMSPRLSGTVSDGVSSAVVADMAAGDLDRLEDPAKIRLPLPFPPEPGFSRTLFHENIDGFDQAHVFRKSPQLLNLARTAPFGFSGSAADLRSFSRAAVLQHFPRSIARVENVDLRLPTERELEALEAFQLSLEFPAGNDRDELNLDRFATTTAQRLGRQVFFGPVAKCSRCHGGPLLNETDGTVGKPAGLASFNTGVSAQPINEKDGLPQEPGADGTVNGREFNVPSLFNVEHTRPLFHDGSAATVGAALFFYNDSPFNESPAGAAVGGISFDELPVADFNNLLAFVRGLTVRPYSLRGGPVNFGDQPINHGPWPARTVVITNSSSAPIQFQTGGLACTLTGPGSNQFDVVDCPLDEGPLLPGRSRNIRVSFSPASLGPKHAVLEINAADPSGVDLTGNGVPFPTQALVRSPMTRSPAR